MREEICTACSAEHKDGCQYYEEDREGYVIGKYDEQYSGPWCGFFREWADEVSWCPREDWYDELESESEDGYWDGHV